VTVVSHNPRALKYLRDEGYFAEMVEHWDSFTRRRHDLFGFIDILAVGNGETVGVQVTSRNNMSSRRTKMQASPVLAAMWGAGWKVWLFGYDKPAHRWRLRVEEVPSVTPLNA